MPQLPSGCHVGVDPQPLNDLLDGVVQGSSTVVWPLLAIDSPQALSRYLEVVYFQRGEDGEVFNPLAGSLPIDSELKMVRTGLMVSNVLSGDVEGWSEGDRHVYEQFIMGERARPFFEEHLARVKAFCDVLLEHGSPVQRVEVATWHSGCHWLQQEWRR